MSKLPTLYPIPAGTPPSRCKGSTCGATIYFVGRMPLSVNAELHPECEEPTPLLDGAGVSHFKDCADVGEFSRGKK